MKDVFISYKAEEIHEANWVKSELESNGLSCWMAPGDIPGGSNYAAEIPQAIRQCKVLVLLLSTKAQTSPWVAREVDLALNERKVVMPFMLEDCILQDDFNFYLTNVQRYAAYNDKAAAMQIMIQQIKSIVGPAPVDPPAADEPEQSAPSLWRLPDDISQQPPAPVPAPVRKKVEVLSLLSMIFGILSIPLGTFFIFQIAAIVLACLGAWRLRKKPATGKAFALVGLIIGMVMLLLVFTFALSVIGLILALLMDGGSLFLFLWQLKKLKKAAKAP